MKIELNIDGLRDTLNTSVRVSEEMNGSKDPNFRRIFHHNHHIVLYLKDHIMKDACKGYFEIGTHFGHSISNIMQSKYPSKIATCDLFQVGVTIAKDCKVSDVESLAISNIEKFNINGYDYRIFKGSSHSREVHNRVSSYFVEGIDILFIDGDHRRKAVLSDFEMYFPLVNPGGYIIFDDYLPYMWNGKLRECPIAINDLIVKHNEKLRVVGLVEDLAGSNELKSGISDKNSCFIVQKV